MLLVNSRVVMFVTALAAASCALGAPRAKAAEGRREAIDAMSQAHDLATRGDVAGAIEAARHSITLAPSPAAYLELGKLYKKQGDTKAAREALQKALELNPNYELARLEIEALGKGDSGDGAVMTDSAVRVDAAQREYETMNSLRPTPKEVADAAVTPRPTSKWLNWIPRAPQNPGAGDKPRIPSAPGQPAQPGYARRAIEPSVPTEIINETHPTIIENQPGGKTEPRGKELPKAKSLEHSPSSNTIDAPAATEPASSVPQPAATQGGSVINSAKGGQPSANDVNAAAFGQDAKAQKPSLGFQNKDKIALGTFAFHKHQADVYRDSQRWEEAASEYGLALQASPGDADTASLYAEMLSRAGHIQEAEIQFGLLEKGAKNSASAYYRRGNFYRERGKLAEAAAAFKNAVRVEPKNRFAHNNLGVVLMEEGQYDGATREFKRVLELDPSYDKAMLNLGIIYDDNLNDDQQALQYYDMYLKRGGDRSAEVQKWVEAIRGKAK